jgi:ABC-2 type transport system ATP-binding protein
MTDDAVTIEKLRKTFRTGFWGRQVEVLRGVDLTVRRGEILGLLGPNGAGKSTTLKCVLRLVFPTSGEIHIFGVSNRSPAALSRVGYMPEHPALYPRLLPLEVLDFAGRLVGLSRGERDERAQRLVHEVGLDHAIDRPVGRYSKGMKQRIGLAQALMGEPELLILDEPFSGLDPIGRKEVRDILLAQRERGKTLVFTSHILSDVERLCDRVALLKGGAISACASLEELLRPEVRRFELELGAAPAGFAERFGAAVSTRATGERGVHLEVEGEATLDAVIDAARAERLRILAVTPRRESLEDLIIRDALDL